jgi:hypothetical protein
LNQCDATKVVELGWATGVTLMSNFACATRLVKKVDLGWLHMPEGCSEARDLVSDLWIELRAGGKCRRFRGWAWLVLFSFCT